MPVIIYHIFFSGTNYLVPHMLKYSLQTTANFPSPPVARVGKMKRDRGGLHYSSRNGDEDEEVICPGINSLQVMSMASCLLHMTHGTIICSHYLFDPLQVVAPSLPTEFTLPVNSMPKFAFESTVPQSDGVMSMAPCGSGSPPFTFSSPITQTSPDVAASSPVSPKVNKTI